MKFPGVDVVILPYSYKSDSHRQPAFGSLGLQLNINEAKLEDNVLKVTFTHARQQQMNEAKS